MKSETDSLPRTNWALVIVSIVIAYGLAQYEPFHNFLLNLGDWGLIGLLIIGFFFAFTFTISTAVVALLVFGQILPAWEIGLIAAIGATLGDFLIYNFIRRHIVYHASKLLARFRKSPLVEMAKTTYFKWTLPILGAIIIASPFPDELGMTLLGIAKVKVWQFMILSFALNVVGITLVAMASNWITL